MIWEVKHQMKRTLNFSFLFLVLLFCFAAVNAAAQTGNIDGTVTDADSGLPLEGVMVRAIPAQETDDHGHGGHWGHMAITGEDGTYLMDEVEPGMYMVKAMLPGYYFGEAELEVLADETATADFALTALMYGALSGAVTDADTGLPLAGAFVRVHVTEPEKTKNFIFGGGTRHHGGGCGQHYHAMTGEDGTYFIDNVIVDYYNVNASLFGYNPAEPVGLYVLEGDTGVADFALTPMTYGSLEGYVTDADTGLPIEYAMVMLRRDTGDMTTHEGGGHGGGPGGGGHHGGHFNWAFTDENGYYFMEMVPTGDYIGYAGAWGYEFVEGAVTVVEDETAQLDFALPPYVE